MTYFKGIKRNQSIKGTLSDEEGGRGGGRGGGGHTKKKQRTQHIAKTKCSVLCRASCSDPSPAFDNFGTSDINLIF